MCRDFSHVVLTCRTQFFPKEESEAESRLEFGCIVNAWAGATRCCWIPGSMPGRRFADLAMCRARAQYGAGARRGSDTGACIPAQQLPPVG